MEKVVANQIKGHVDGFGLDNPFQSAYKAFHSTETALLSVTNDISNLICSISIASNLRYKTHSGHTNHWDNQSHSLWSENRSGTSQEY